MRDLTPAAGSARQVASAAWLSGPYPSTISVTRSPANQVRPYSTGTPASSTLTPDEPQQRVALGQVQVQRLGGRGAHHRQPGRGTGVIGDADLFSALRSRC